MPDYWNNVHRDEAAGRKRIDAERLALMARFAEGNVLDMGCGNGELLRWLAYEKPGLDWLTGVDFSPEAVRIAQERQQKTMFTVGDIADIADMANWPVSHYDTVILTETLEHVGNEAVVIANIRRVAKDGANVIITVPYKDRNRSPEHVREYTIEDAVRIGNAIGTVMHIDTLGDYANWLSLVLVAKVRKDSEPVVTEEGLQVTEHGAKAPDHEEEGSPPQADPTPDVAE